MKKKFVVRIRIYWKEMYCIEYCHYRFFKKWKFVKKWLGHPYNHWNPVMADYVTIEIKARQFKTIQDIHRHHEEERLKRDNELKERADKLAKAQPFKSKIIIP